MGKLVEEVINVGRTVDKVTCEEKFKGAVDQNGNCLVRIILTSDPTKAELRKIGYTGPAPAGVAPQP